MLASAYPSEVKQWENMIEEWEQDNMKPCPYTTDPTGAYHTSIPHTPVVLTSGSATLSYTEVRKNLLEHELGDEETHASNTTGSITEFITLTLEVEDDQYVHFMISLLPNIYTNLI